MNRRNVVSQLQSEINRVFGNINNTDSNSATSPLESGGRRSGDSEAAESSAAPDRGDVGASREPPIAASFSFWRGCDRSSLTFPTVG
jgi:hypothetical protein